MMQTQTRSDNAAASPGDASPVISVRNLRMGYGARVLLDDASFDVRRGEIVVILGGSGSGKSSLMKNIIGLYQPMAGDILIDGRSIVTASADEKAAAAAQARGDVPERRPVRLAERARERALSARSVHRPRARGEEPDRAHAAAPGRDGPCRVPDAGGALRRHAEARRHRARDGARLRHPAARRALGRPRPDHRRQPGPDHPLAAQEPGLHLRGGDPRVAEHLRHRRPGDHAGPGLAQHHRRRQAGRPARPQHRPPGAPVLQSPARRGRGRKRG